MAAGEGRRLRPVSARWAKPVLPIDGRPVLATLLRELARSGIERATVVTGHHAEQVEALAGDGRAFGVTVRYARQERPDGSADAVACALRAGAPPPALVTAADTLYSEGDVGRFLDAYAAAGASGALAARRDPPPGPGKPPVEFVDGRVVRVIAERGELSSAPLWVLGEAVVPYLDGLPGPPFELALAFQRAIDAGQPVAGIEIGPTRDLTRPVDLMGENFPYLAGL